MSFNLLLKNFRISLPTTIVASFFIAILTVLVFGTALTEISGLPQVPAPGFG